MQEASRAAEVERSSLCNCVVNFLLKENYLLTAFELLHELVEDGRHDQAIRLREFFSDPSLFPPDRIARFNSLRVADPQILLEEKVKAEEKLAISEYELRLAQEDLSRLNLDLQKLSETSPVIESNGSNVELPMVEDVTSQMSRKERSLFDLGPLKDSERKDLNCAVKEYLLFAGYRLTAMTFYEEVTDQNLDISPNSPACVFDALRRYYFQYLSCTEEAAEEKLIILRENESLSMENEVLKSERNLLVKAKDVTDAQIVVLTKSLEAAQKDLKERESMLQSLKQSLELQRKELNDCRSEITALKMHIEGFRSSRGLGVAESEVTQPASADKDDRDASSAVTQYLNGVNTTIVSPETVACVSEDGPPIEKVVEMHEINESLPKSVDLTSGLSYISDVKNTACQSSVIEPCNNALETLADSIEEKLITFGDTLPTESSETVHKARNLRKEMNSEKMALETIQILSDALPKIVPYVLINHREELLPLMMCAIERHPESSVRDSLTHTLFNLIKRPDEQQRIIIMDACVSLAKNVGEMRTETELLPQCWEQINHTYEERRLLVAQSCGELAEFVRPEICDSLILSIVQQLVEDAATVVREAAAHNLALLLPFFPNMDKYFKVEELMFQLACDPSRTVVDATLHELVPSVIKWGNKLDNVLKILLSDILESSQRCPPLSGVEGSVESYLRVLGERERWNIDVLLRMLVELLPFIQQKAIETCPFVRDLETTIRSEPANSFFSPSLLQLYARGHMDWLVFDWLHTHCFPDLIQLACLLPLKEDNIRNRITKFLLDVANLFGDQYNSGIVLPVFLLAIGDSADLAFFPVAIQSRIKGLRPKTAVAARLSVMCVLPILLAGVLGAPTKREQLSDYVRKLLVQSTLEGSTSHSASDFMDSIRFLCTFTEHHGIIFNILWEMVVSSSANLKIHAARLLKVLVPYIDVKVASTHVLPALVTLGSDQNLNVKYASIDAFGAVAQQFKNDMIVEKLRVQMDAFLEDGSHEAAVYVVRALVVAVPHTTDRLREYLLSKIFQFTAVPVHGNDVIRRRERANAFCEAIRALDAADLPANSVKEFLLPSIQNLLKDPDSLDPAHKEALEIILKERSGGTLETISKVMGVNLGLASSVSSFFGESGLLGKRSDAGGDSSSEPPLPLPPTSPRPSPQATSDDTRIRNFMRGSFGGMLRGKMKGVEESPKPSG